jgi:hypothetical protein
MLAALALLSAAILDCPEEALCSSMTFALGPDESDTYYKAECMLSCTVSTAGTLPTLNVVAMTTADVLSITREASYAIRQATSCMAFSSAERCS